MGATRSLNNKKNRLLDRLRVDNPAIQFIASDHFSWSAETRSICYSSTDETTDSFEYSLIHELAHSLLKHTIFRNDIELIGMERDAWDTAVAHGERYGVTIPTEHIEKCMDSYRDWLHARSLCPHCHQCGVQVAKTSYRCIFCDSAWRVPESRLCRVQRRVRSVS